ncbi:DUF3524 domain-containing protein [Hahella sp. KA22]|uniref:tRNA-queuosine alpha-mannosyltransferase domain-containing protein n=1 Tax=Hahella sp. KA22 TaxID=1628392 RepID=UPI000FDF4F0B|nr:DUF3524 domain-containing protein [Hahella sp. KA22]AZZ93818.1 DUF3524 domain-containing protein [Hahella sp. KA22]QAY57191.1 DUF3524 domain-containing protein [Hahella sp. KA22]
MKILLLSAYDVDSHKRWRQGLLKAFPEHDWVSLSLPPRFFRWRIRGAPISWSLYEDEALRGAYDLIVATSMADVATLRGLYPNLAVTPLLVYFHENQLAYPRSEEQHDSIDPAMVNIYAALAADRVVFNTTFNLESFLAGLESLITRLPDAVDAELCRRIRDKSQVIPVPLEDELMRFPREKKGEQPLTIVWNHRVEYDKGVDDLLMILRRLRARTHDFQLVMLGRRFRQAPLAWSQLQEEFAAHLLFDDYAESREAYWRWLSRAHAALSTAQHEFQGLAMMEAAALGCAPVTPDRLSYPELFPHSRRYQDAEEAVDLLLDAPSASPCDMREYAWSALRGVYEDALNNTADRL